MSYTVPNPEEYFTRLAPPRDDLIKELEEEAARENIPIIGPVVGELLYLLARASGARAILELGTATGYSGIYLARALQEPDGRLITLENDSAMAERARSNFRRANLDNLVEVRQGDALREIAAMEGSFDFIFLDIEKRDYLPALIRLENLLRLGGLLVADNTAFEDADEFIQGVSSRPGWRAVHLYGFLPFHSPEYDGLTMALRI